MTSTAIHKNGNSITTDLPTTLYAHNNSRCIAICPGVPWRVAYIIVFITAFLCYFASLEGTFVFDDSEAIVNNEDVKTDTPISQLFYNDFWGTSLLHKSSHKSYRPLTILSFRLNNLLDGGSLNTKFYHLTNLLLHSLCSLLSLVVFSILFDDRKQPRLSFVSSIMFSIHPVHTEAVAGIVGRADLLCGIFYFSSIYFYAQHLKTGSYWCFTTSMTFCGISMLCKEQGVTVLGVLAVYDVMSNRFNLRKMSIMTRQTLCRFLFLFLVGLILLYGRLTVMGSTPPDFMKVDNPASFSSSFLTRILSYNYVYSINGLLLLWPHWLCFDWSMGCIPLLESWKDARNLSSTIFWFLMVSASFKALFSSSPVQRRNLTLGLALIVVPFLPASNLFFRVGFVVAERVLFIPVAGCCLIFIYGLEKLNVIYPNYKVWRGCLLSILLLYGLKSFRRTLDWKDEIQLFQSGLKVCPLNAKVHYNIGKNSADRGQRDEAIARYQLAIQLNPDYHQAMNNLANLFKDSGSLKTAEDLLVRAGQLKPDFTAAWMNLGIVQSLLQKYPEAEMSYLTALKLRRKYPDCQYNLGNLYLEQKKYKEADEAFRNAISLQPTHVLAWTNLIIMLTTIDRIEQSEEVALEALKVLPNEANLHFCLAGILGKQNRFLEAEHYFLSAIQLQPSSPIFHTNLGVLYHRWKRFDRAERSYLRALDLDPGWKSAKENYNLLQKTKRSSRTV